MDIDSKLYENVQRLRKNIKYIFNLYVWNCDQYWAHIILI